MAIQHHPLSNAALGEFLGHCHVDKATVFYYDNGKVILTCPDNKNFKWVTDLSPLTTIDVMRADGYPCLIETEGANDNPNINLDSFSKPFGDKPATIHAMTNDGLDTMEEIREQSSVSSRLDQHSIDGMDDMAFNGDTLREDIADKTNELLANEFSRSAADEASTSNLLIDNLQFDRSVDINE